MSEETKAFAPAAHPSELRALLDAIDMDSHGDGCSAYSMMEFIPERCDCTKHYAAALRAALRGTPDANAEGAKALEIEAIRARAHAEGKAEGLRLIDEAVTTLEAPRNGPQYGEIHEVIEAARQGVLAEYLASQDGDLDRILRAFAARSLIPAAPLPAGEVKDE